MIKRILCGILAMLAMPVTATAGAFGDIVRLHVIAESDSPEDQAFKLRVRDAVVEALEPYLQGCGDSDAVYAALEAGAADAGAAARELAISEGADIPIHVETGIFEFDEREFGGCCVPAGEYRAMRVVIGTGGGHNWWGIMYPDAMPLESDGDTIYYSIVIEWLMELLGGNR